MDSKKIKLVLLARLIFFPEEQIRCSVHYLEKQAIKTITKTEAQTGARDEWWWVIFQSSASFVHTYEKRALTGVFLPASTASLISNVYKPE
jgi:hypothetical protein